MDTPHFHLHFPLCFPHFPIPSAVLFPDQAELQRYEAQEVQRKLKTLEVALGGWKMDGK